MKVLFCVDHAGIAWRYVSLFSELARRGHDVQVDVDPKKARANRLEKDLSGDDPALARVRYGIAPTRARLDGWRSIAWPARALADLARYTHPRFEAARVLRKRAQKTVLGRLRKPEEFDPVARRVALAVGRKLAAGVDADLSGRVIAAAAKVEAAIPTSRRIDRYLRRHAPDVVLVSPGVRVGSDQVDILKSARKLRIPAATCVASWDNLTSKGLLKFVPERVFVWNEFQRREAIDLHGIPGTRVVETGAQLFDRWFDREVSGPREQFVSGIGLDPARPYVLFLGSSPFVVRKPTKEVQFVLEWIQALRASGDEQVRQCGVVIRPHPAGKHWHDAELGFDNVVVWPPRSRRPASKEEEAVFFDSLAHSAAVVGINTTAMIEAAILGKSVLTILEPRFAQENTLHFGYLLESNGGFLHVATSLAEHTEQLGRVLNEKAGDAERRRSFVEAFVRPHGLEHRATPILADAVEELAGLSVQPAATPVMLRLILRLDLPLASTWLLALPARKSLRRLRHRIYVHPRDRRRTQLEAPNRLADQSEL